MSSRPSSSSPRSTRSTWPSRSPGSGRLIALVGGLADGDVVLDAGCDWDRAREQLLALPGIGPWTAEVIAMRGLGDPDAFPATDLGVLAGRQAARLAARIRGPSPSTARAGGRGVPTPPNTYGPPSTIAVNHWPPDKEKCMSPSSTAPSTARSGC